ncbi:MAG: DUF2971 domain-containing protein [Bacillota bacterium]
MASRIPKTLYHYCSLPNFQKIIEGKTLWLTDISQSNDSLEMKWLYDEFLLYFTKKQTEYFQKVISIQEKYNELHKYDKNDSRSYIQYLEETRNNPPPKIPEYDPKKIEEVENSIRLYQNMGVYLSFVFCLSELPDSLSQWRGYADDGCGIAIGFKKAYFSLFNQFDGTEIEDLFSFNRIMYGSKNAQLYFDEVSEFSKISENSSSDDIIRIAEKTLFKISRRAASYKNESFKEEKEWRITITIKNFNYTSDTFDIGLLNSKELFLGKYCFDKIAFASTKDKLIPHIELRLPELKDAISDIYIGPKSKLTIDQLRMFLTANGLLSSTDDKSIAIHHSASSYR